MSTAWYDRELKAAHDDYDSDLISAEELIEIEKDLEAELEEFERGTRR